jgi:hypothetical protein
MWDSTLIGAPVIVRLPRAGMRQRHRRIRLLLERRPAVEPA